PCQDRSSGSSCLRLPSHCQYPRRLGGRSARSCYRVAGPEPDLQMAFARMREDDTQALVALENPVIGVHAADRRACIAARAVDNARAGASRRRWPFKHGTSLGTPLTAWHFKQAGYSKAKPLPNYQSKL